MWPSRQKSTSWQIRRRSIYIIYRVTIRSIYIIYRISALVGEIFWMLNGKSATFSSLQTALHVSQDPCRTALQVGDWCLFWLVFSRTFISCGNKILFYQCHTKFMNICRKFLHRAKTDTLFRLSQNKMNNINFDFPFLPAESWLFYLLHICITSTRPRSSFVWWTLERCFLFFGFCSN